MILFVNVTKTQIVFQVRLRSIELEPRLFGRYLSLLKNLQKLPNLGHLRLPSIIVLLQLYPYPIDPFLSFHLALEKSNTSRFAPEWL
jgi:hypothetical protein